MTVSVESTSKLGRKLKIAVPSAVIADKKKAKLKHFAKTMKIDGFRKGKVPETFIQQKYGEQLHNETISELIGSTLEEALKQENLVPADMPKVEKIEDVHGQDLQYEVEFEILPQVVIADFKAIELERPVADITAEDIDKGIASLQEQFAGWQPVDRAAANGDKLTIDFVGSIDGVPFKNGDGKNVSLEIGSGRFIPGFEESLIGASAGEYKTIDVTFPVNYGAAELAGKPAQFAVTVHTVESKQLAEVDVEFAKKIGLADGNVDQIRDQVKKNMAGFLVNIVQEELRNQATDKLLAVNQFDVPASLLEREKTAILENDEKNNVTRDPDQLIAEADKRVRLGLLLNKIIEQHNIQPDQEKLRAKLNELSAMLGGNVELIQRIYNGSKELLAKLKSSVLSEQAIDLVIEYATIKDKVSNFYDIANRSA